jgi:hypothetical protein
MRVQRQLLIVESFFYWFWANARNRVQVVKSRSIFFFVGMALWRDGSSDAA